MNWPKDPRQAPLRIIVKQFVDPDHGTFNELECGHTRAVSDTEGHGKRQRCQSCKYARLRGEVGP